MDFADVVKERDALEGAEPVCVEIGGVAEDERISRDAAEVLAGFVIGGLDGVEQRFERGGGEAFTGFLSSVLEAEQDEGSEEQAVGHSGRREQEARKNTKPPVHGNALGV